MFRVYNGPSGGLYLRNKTIAVNTRNRDNCIITTGLVGRIVLDEKTASPAITTPSTYV